MRGFREGGRGLELWGWEGRDLRDTLGNQKRRGRGRKGLRKVTPVAPSLSGLYQRGFSNTISNTQRLQIQRVNCLGPFLLPICQCSHERVGISRGKANVQTNFVQSGNLVNRLGKKANVPVGRGTLAVLYVFPIPGFPNGEGLNGPFTPLPRTLLFLQVLG